MIAQYYHPELVRFAFVFGIVISIAFYERRHLTTGGIAVPGYLAFAIFEPLILPAVLGTAYLTYLLIHKGLARRVVLPAPVKFSMTILCSSGVHLALDAMLITQGAVEASSSLLRGIGYVVPGLIAHDFTRHGVGRTVTNIGMSTTFVAITLALIVLALPETAMLQTSPVQDVFPIGLAYLPLMIFLSLIAWLGIVRFHGLRCGGFLGGAYLTLLVLQPDELVQFLAVALTTLLVVRYLLDPIAILFGRRRLAAHMLIGSCLSWATFRIEELFLSGDSISVMTPSLAVVGVLLSGLLASDMDRVGIYRTLLGSFLSVAFTLTGTLMLLEVITLQRPEVVLPLLILFVAGGLLMATPRDLVRKILQHLANHKNNKNGDNSHA